VTQERGFAVKRKRFSVEQIVGILKQGEVAVPVGELIRQAGISEQTFYRWEKHYVGPEETRCVSCARYRKRMYA
jgi:hypothetical protein